MSYLKIIKLSLFFILTIAGGPEAVSAPAAPQSCPALKRIPKIQIFDYQAELPSEPNKEIGDVGTSIVVESFFSTPDTLFNFMKLVYGDIDNALKKFRKSLDLEDRALFIVFKGGNVLRMVANGLFARVPLKAREILLEAYLPNFKRSDSDFSVYLDEKRIGKLDYEKVFADVTDLVFSELNIIRSKLMANPKKYFNFSQLSSNLAHKELAKYFDDLKNLESTKDSDNDLWYKANFKQLQLLDDRAKLELKCPYQGQFDFKMEIKNNKTINTRLSDKPNWIVNSDNKTIQLPWGIDPQKKTKFSLVRSKVVFEYTIEKDGQLQRRPVGGELIDVSLSNRQSDELRHFLDNYVHNVAVYKLISKSTDEELSMKAYSIPYLAEDLNFIIFKSYDRPWNGGPKYGKRINRIFFLSIIELLANYGLGSPEIKEYVKDIRNKILEPSSNLFPLGANSKALAKIIIDNFEKITKKWPTLSMSNNFWQGLTDLVHDRLVKKALDGDKDGFKSLLETIENNLEIIYKMGDMPVRKKINIDDLYDVDLDSLF